MNDAQTLRVRITELSSNIVAAEDRFNAAIRRKDADGAIDATEEVSLHEFKLATFFRSSIPDILAALTPPKGHVRDELGVDRKLLGVIPVTKDGCFVGSGVQLYHPEYDDPCYETHIEAYFDDHHIDSEWQPVGGCEPIEDLYSTKMAAQIAARRGANLRLLLRKRILPNSHGLSDVRHHDRRI